ncbi:hypothetical protein [Streptomyces mirabilis]|uniref:hypothetical protein n=1 Tax=Streptomyces mirabilis TaxID=68239 RepID=UPI003692B375
MPGSTSSWRAWFDALLAWWRADAGAPRGGRQRWKAAPKRAPDTGEARVRGPKLTDLVAVTPETVPGQTHTAPVPLFSSGAETATCPPTNAVRLPNRSPFSAVPGTPGVFWPISAARAAHPFAPSPWIHPEQSARIPGRFHLQDLRRK